MSLLERIRELVRPIAEEHHAYVVDVSVRGERGVKVAEVFIDADEGVTATLCQGISRELSRKLDAVESSAGSYDLVVSSPGIDRPLRFPRQYPKHVGRAIELSVREGSGVSSLKGTLLGAGEESILLGVDGKEERRIPFGDIIEARIVAAW
jgi:ribosome maturation factor RimP